MDHSLSVTCRTSLGAVEQNPPAGHTSCIPGPARLRRRTGASAAASEAPEGRARALREEQPRLPQPQQAYSWQERPSTAKHKGKEEMIRKVNGKKTSKISTAFLYISHKYLEEEIFETVTYMVEVNYLEINLRNFV